MPKSRCNFDPRFLSIKNIVDMIDPGDTVISRLDLCYKILQKLIKVIRWVTSFNDVLVYIHRIERQPNCSHYSGFVSVLI